MHVTININKDYWLLFHSGPFLLRTTTSGTHGVSLISVQSLALSTFKTSKKEPQSLLSSPRHKTLFSQGQFCPTLPYSYPVAEIEILNGGARVVNYPRMKGLVMPNIFRPRPIIATPLDDHALLRPGPFCNTDKTTICEKFQCFNRFKGFLLSIETALWFF